MDAKGINGDEQYPNDHREQYIYEVCNEFFGIDSYFCKDA